MNNQKPWKMPQSGICHKILLPRGGQMPKGQKEINFLENNRCDT